MIPDYDKLIALFDTPNWGKRLRSTSDIEMVNARKRMIELTPFLPDDATPLRRAWHIRNNAYSIPMCPQCNEKEIGWQNHKNRYGFFCSTRCAGNSEQAKAKVKQTNLEKYGVEYGIFSADIRKKMESTNMVRYGGKSSLASERVRADIAAKNMEKYGTSVPFLSDEINQKRKETMLEKYGTVHALQNQNSMEKMQETMLERYGTVHALQNEEIYSKAMQTNIDRFGVEYAKQQHISPESLVILKDEQALRELHHTQQLPLIKIADRLGVSSTTVSSYVKYHGIEILYRYTSFAEREIAQFLIDSGVQDVTTCNRSIISPQELDIYVPSKKLAIEFNGLYWHSEINKDSRYHYQKYKTCTDKGIRCIQIFEDEWEERSEIIKSKLLHILGLSAPQYNVFARKTTIKLVDIATKSCFFEANHIQGDGPSSINYGLYNDEELVACIGFIEKPDHLVLNRYCTSKNVVGGFSKLLKFIEKQYNNPKIITFADLRWSVGELYYSNGFKMDKLLKPDYYWVKNLTRKHKFNFRHNSGLKDLPNYDPSLSETKNMHNHGFYKIYDAGKLRFIKNF